MGDAPGRVIADGKRVVLRRPILSDADYSYKWFSDPQVTEFLPLSGKGNIPLENCRRFIKGVIESDRPEYSITIEAKDQVEKYSVIGCGGFRNFLEDESAEISLIIGEPEYWGKGYARESMEWQRIS